MCWVCAAWPSQEKRFQLLLLRQLPSFGLQTGCAPHQPTRLWRLPLSEGLMRGILLAVAGNAPDDSRVCNEDLETEADVMLTDTCRRPQSRHRCAYFRCSRAVTWKTIHLSLLTWAQSVFGSQNIQRWRDEQRCGKRKLNKDTLMEKVIAVVCWCGGVALSGFAYDLRTFNASHTPVLSHCSPTVKEHKYTHKR